MKRNTWEPVYQEPAYRRKTYRVLSHRSHSRREQAYVKRTFIMFLATLLYMELIYHLASFGFKLINPILLIPSVVVLAGLETAGVGFFRRRKNKVLLWILLAVDYLIYASQMVYLSIFKQPMLMAVVINTGQDAVTNYWREALHAIWLNTGYLLLLAVPLPVIGWLLYCDILRTKSHKVQERVGALLWSGVGLLATLLLFVIGYFARTEYYEAYQEFYDPSMIIEEYGVLASVQRDVLGGALPAPESAMDAWVDQSKNNVTPPESAGAVSGGDGESAWLPEETETEPEVVVDTSPNVLPIDFAALEEMADTKDLQKLVSFLEAMEPTNKNEYTGMFAGYNLIYLTAEGFSSYAVDEQITPTLYKLVNSGLVVEDYYVPLWQTSTSDGEYVNLMGLIPDQQSSMRRSSDNAQPFSLPAYFAKEGVKSFAYHNNSLSYYDRHRSHPNLGYDFRASKLGKLSEAEWGSHVFEMEHANYWPASDLDMMKATIPEYIYLDRFHVYYMTVSGHMNYNFSGNKMSSLNREAVADLPYSEEGRAYIACNVELDKALEYLIAELDKAGKLEKTVIVLSADHYPYDMDMGNLEELAGKPLDGTLDLYRNSLIFWNSEMETIKIDKVCGAMDLLPTIYNLFGFQYDSRLYAGRDMLSDSPSLVIFTNRSFITDTIEYNRKTKTTTSRTGEAVDEEYLAAMQQQVKGIYEYSARILNNDFYRYVEMALPADQWERAPQMPIEVPDPPEPEPEPDPVPEGDTDGAGTDAGADQNDGQQTGGAEPLG
ncbi:MAG: LTA synthase family protein [Lachnospiraceae bacterium]|nr:LTA synthase family protein [Lachnospiraceae bacterium]